MSTEITLPVTGMTCGGCENAVKRAVGTLPGVEKVDASHQQASVTVTFDDARVSKDDIARKIGQLGYTVPA